MRKLELHEVPWVAVHDVFDWTRPATIPMTVEQVCLACGYQPTVGDKISVAKHMSRKYGVRFERVRGKRICFMPPLAGKGA